MRFANYLLLTLLLCAGGCTSYFTETNPPPAWDQSRYEKRHKENQQRLLGEDKSESTAGDVITYIPRQLWAVVEWTWNVSTGHTASKYAKELFHRNPDIRRDAVYTLSDQRWGRQPPYTEYYAHMAVDDSDATVRMAALRALNRSRDQKQTAAYIAEMTDESWWVRVEAVKAIANIPDPKAVPGLMKITGDEQQKRDVRIASADALRCYQQSDVAQSLIRVLSDPDYGLAWQARQSLNLMTAKDFAYDQSAWLNYLTSNPKPFAASTR